MASAISIRSRMSSARTFLVLGNDSDVMERACERAGMSLMLGIADGCEGRRSSIHDQAPFDPYWIRHPLSHGQAVSMRTPSGHTHPAQLIRERCCWVLEGVTYSVDEILNRLVAGNAGGAFRRAA